MNVPPRQPGSCMPTEEAPRRRAFARRVALLIPLTLIVSLLSPIAALATDGVGVPCIHTGTETVATDKADYAPGETVHISGTGYAPSCDVEIRVTRPDGSVVTGDGSFTPGTDVVTTDLSGNLTYDYILNGIVGDYLIEALGLQGVVLATTTFTDGIAAVDVAPAFYPSNPGPVRFSVLVRNTGGSSVRCVRVTVPSGYTGVTLVTWSVGVSGWSATTSGNQITLTGAPPAPVLPSSGSTNWARLEVDATPPNTTTADWVGFLANQATCSGNPDSQDAGVLIGSVSQKTYTADFRDSGGNVVSAETGVAGVSKEYRLRITNTSGSNGDDVKYAVIALPSCFTSPTIPASGVTTSNGGDPDFSAEVKDGFIRLQNGVLKKDVNPDHYVEVRFTTTPASGCSTVFRTAVWKSSEHSETAEDTFEIAGSHPGVTLGSANDPPDASDDEATVDEDSGATAIDVLGNDDDPDGDTLTITAVTQPANGTVAITGSGTGLTYEPDANYCNDGTPTDDFTYTISDPHGETDTATVAVTVTCVDDPPTAVGDTATVAEDAAATAIDVLSNDSDIDGGPKTIESVTQPANGTVVITGGGTGLTYQPDANYCNDGDPTDDFTYTLNGGSTATVAVTDTCVNDPPVADDETVTTNEDTAVDTPVTTLLDGDTDVDGDTLTVTAVSGASGGTAVLMDNGTPANKTDDFVRFTPAANLCGAEAGNYDYMVSDGNGATDTGHVTVNITCVNDAPSVTITSPAYGSLYAVGDTVNVTASFTDPDTTDVHTCSINWDDGTTTPGIVSETNGSGTCTGSHAYAQAGVYTITVTVTDAGGLSDTDEVLVVVYDPDAGFVTGGGWINSPAGAYAADPTMTGRANFGFVSKYQRGATTPTGQTEFLFQAASFNFHSSNYQWLVVSGAKAQFKGTGTVNGESGFSFLLTATDGQLTGGGGTDRFRIKIWHTATGAPVYDNVIGASDDIDSANPQVIAGGSIVIHKGKK